MLYLDPTEKKCFKCDTMKPIEEFYHQKYMSDGRLNKCKACTIKDVMTNRRKNREMILI